ncbi:MAG: hypothetical protein ACTSUO_05095 [Candidatus Thorarchaeota archaeon]
MSNNYERNNTMIACILGFIIVGAVAVGAITFLGGSSFNWNLGDVSTPDWNNTTTFAFDRTETSMPTTVTLDLDIDVGAISVEFDDNSTLLYQIDLEVPNPTIETHGDPTVTYTTNTIGVDYEVALVNVTLGNSTSYVIDIDILTGAVSIVIDANAIVGDIDITTTTGAISLTMTDAATLTGDAAFDLDTTTGGINIIVDLQSGIGGSFIGASTVGSIDITPSGWTEISAGNYETSDYDTASQTLAITANVVTGSISAILT